MSSKKPWSELTDLEKREQIALRLGWTLAYGRNCWRPSGCWHSPIAGSPHLLLKDLPDWPTNDGLAFEEVWPRLCESFSVVDLNWSRHESAMRREISVITDVGETILFHENTWADAICHAAYETLPLSKVEGE